MHDQEIPSAPGTRGAVGVIIRQDRMLIIQRSDKVVAPGAYCFPGGAIEQGESEEEALVREIREELGVTVRPIRRLWRNTTPWKVDLSWWLADLDVGETLAPNAAEVASFQWVTLDEMARLPDLLGSNRQFLDAFIHGAFALPLRYTGKR